MKSEGGNFTVTKSIALNQEKRGAIVGLKGFLEGKIKHLESDRKYIVGREDEKCDILVEGKTVSRIHFEITYNSATKDYTVCDRSKNGTVVDGARKLPKDKEVKLKGGRRLCLGESGNEIILG